MAGKPAAGSIRSMMNDPKPGGAGERRADVAIRRANDPRVVPDRGTVKQRAAANDPPVRTGRNAGSNLGKYLHPAKGKR